MEILDSRFHGNDKIEGADSCFHGNDIGDGDDKMEGLGSQWMKKRINWIPVFTGMTKWKG